MASSILRHTLFSMKLTRSVSLRSMYVTRYHCCAASPAVRNSVLFTRSDMACSLKTHRTGFLQHQTLPSSVHLTRHLSMAYYFTADFPPIAAAVQLFTFVHDMSGLPWWISIIVTTLTVRLLVTLPLSVMSQKTSARLQKLQPELGEKAYILKCEVEHARIDRGWTERTTRRQFNKNMRRIQGELFIRDNCHPLKVIVSTLLQLPLWVALTVGLRNMCGGFINDGDLPVLRPDLALEGTLWFDNLLLIDPFYILPVITVLANLINIEMGFRKIPQTSKGQRIVKNLSRGLTLIFLPFGAVVPSGIFLYWTSSSVYSLVQNSVLLFPKVRRTLNIPETPLESKTPIQDMLRHKQTLKDEAKK